MNKTRFQLPPRAGSAAGVDYWVNGAAASRRTDTKAAFASGKPEDSAGSLTFPFLFDIAALLDAHRCNMEAISAVNRIMREGACAAARRNLEIMQQAIDGFSERVQTMGSPECPRDRAMRQTETVIKTYEDATANMQELGEIIRHASTEAMEVVGRRFTEAADEVKSLARLATRNFWDTEAKPEPFWEQT